MVYTNNYVVSPSFQQGMTGFYSIVNDASSNPTGVMYLDDTNVLYGTSSLLVLTNGQEPGEGVNLSPGTAVSNASYSASCYMQGTGMLSVHAIVNGSTVASSSVTLTGQWFRVVFNGITLTTGQVLSLQVVTTTTQSAQFYVSGTQVEDSATAHPYCDGDLPGCYWTSAYGGTSYQPVANPATGTMAIHTSTYFLPILHTGLQQFATMAGPMRSHDYMPVLFTGAAAPVGAVTDFSVALLTDPDPAQTYASWTNSANTSGVMPTSSYFRSWGVFIPPADYVVSNGAFLYNRAAYAAIGWQATMANAATATLAKIQAEELPVTTGYSAPAPSAFDTPRNIHSIVEPNRINFVPNPSIEVSTASWSATGSAAIARDTTTSVGQIGTYDDFPVTTGTCSLKVTVNANSDGASIGVSGLLTGFTYIASAYVLCGPGLANILMQIANGSTSITASGGTGYNYNGYGAGGYGGVSSSGSDQPTNVWFRIYTMFQATTGTNTLSFNASSAADVSYPTHIWVDGVMVEEGENLNQYFDGSNPAYGYYWEGTTGLSRSYFYNRLGSGSQAINDTLARHIPYGISYTAPVFKTPPIG